MFDWNQYCLRFRNVRYIYKRLELIGYSKRLAYKQIEYHWRHIKDINNTIKAFEPEAYLSHYNYWTVRNSLANKGKLRHLSHQLYCKDVYDYTKGETNVRF